MIVDIQGVGGLYTDPQIHFMDDFDEDVKDPRRPFFARLRDMICTQQTSGNLGSAGIGLFLRNHRCNSICKCLDLISRPGVAERTSSDLLSLSTRARIIAPHVFERTKRNVQTSSTSQRVHTLYHVAMANAFAYDVQQRPSTWLQTVKSEAFQRHLVQSCTSCHVDDTSNNRAQRYSAALVALMRYDEDGVEDIRSVFEAPIPPVSVRRIDDNETWVRFHIWWSEALDDEQRVRFALHSNFFTHPAFWCEARRTSKELLRSMGRLNENDDVVRRARLWTDHLTAPRRHRRFAIAGLVASSVIAMMLFAFRYRSCAGPTRRERE